MKQPILNVVYWVSFVLLILPYLICGLVADVINLWMMWLAYQRRA